jgi:RNA polymerase sigma-54 factor
MKQSLHLKQSLKLSSQQIQVMKLLQLPTQAFEQRLIEEMNENPALELDLDQDIYEKDEFDNNDDDFDDYEDNENIDSGDINIDEYLSNDEIPDYKTQANNHSEDDEERNNPLAAPISFHQDLINQLNTFILTDFERDIAEFLVGSIDDMGYLRRSIPDMVDDMAFTQAIYTDEKTVQKVLHIIHELEPTGVGAANLQECLLLQLKRKTPTEYVAIAIDILENHFDAFTKLHYEKIAKELEISQETLKKAYYEIEKLNPKPGNTYTATDKNTEHIVPDFTIQIVEDQLLLTLNSRNAPSLHVSKDYQDMLQTYKSTNQKSHSQKDAVQFIKQKLDSAKWFIDAIRQRQETLFLTMNAIMNFQQEYFLDGEENKLKPMILKDIADIVGLDLSTVSRVANSKYVETPYGTKLVKEFFSEAMKNNEGEDVSTIEVKKILQEIIDTEDKHKPATDEQIMETLNQKGFSLARRTIAKYRESMDIPVARLRKKI